MDIKISTKTQDIIFTFDTCTCCNAFFFSFFFFCTKISGKHIQYYIPSTESHGFDSLVLHLLPNNYELLFLTKVTKVNSIEKDKKKYEMKYQE
jgi:hypothetical protein